MATQNESWEDNVPGNWYVDKNCILCGVCIDVAPDHFKESDSGDHAYVYKQPETEEEIQSCNESKDQCPVESIGNDGK